MQNINFMLNSRINCFIIFIIMNAGVTFVVFVMVHTYNYCLFKGTRDWQ
jgi:hypothetical protein